MIPAGAFGIVVFFLFVAPGICYELLRDRTRLPREESTFVHISRVLLFGTFITVISVFLMALVRWISPTSLLNLPDLLLAPTTYVADHAVLVGWTLFVQLALSASFAVVFSDVVTSRAAKGRPIHQADAWHAICEEAAEPYEYVKLSVHLKSGRDILGVYVGASTDLDPTKRELILGAPLEDRMAGSDRAVSMNEAWQRIVVPGSEIEYFAASYVGVAKSPGSTTSGVPHRARTWVSSHWRSWKVAAPTALVLLLVCVLL
ncbi:DUF6338 family protein [Actinophytocola algeriensis]|uniref:Uncharacterized protein n=1 Tax=Actinophytocola algeriensis TaxID=1768010 RepID=A0A7W7QBT0_9PSEU|nr:DUF6338 family protein [Actinophytocola algeriensis]MBB4910593.1 hypothetical protein [Actinophytocola algeriensis]MBE1480419.1 hypothetical protein [Actinophytocola algeriensis]